MNPIPRPINDALLAAGIPIPLDTLPVPPPDSSHSTPAGAQLPLSHPPYKTPVPAGAPLSPTLFVQDLKSPGRDFPNSTSTPSTLFLDPQQFYWTPFPDNAEGIPLPLPSDNTAMAMDISSVLDLGAPGAPVDPRRAQLHRDGFTMRPQPDDGDRYWHPPPSEWGATQPPR